MKQMKYKSVLVLLICLLVQMGTTVSAQHTELKWLRGWVGGFGDNRDRNNGIEGLVVDDEGNTYVAGRLKDRARFLDRTIASPVDDSLPACRSHGVIVAKFDTAGNLIWRKVCRSNLNGIQSMMHVSGLELRGDRLYLLMNYFLEADFNSSTGCPLQLWFFDTMYSWPFDYRNNPNPNHWIPYFIPDSLRHFPFNTWNGGEYAAFVVFDLDGNRLEHHSVSEKHPDYPNREYQFGPFVVDSKKNINLFCNRYSNDTGCLTPNDWYYFIDDDTTRLLTYDEIYGCSGEGYDTVPACFHLIKIDSNWNIVGGKRMTYRLDTRQLPKLPYVSDSSWIPWDAVGIIISGVSIDKEDNIYMQACLRTVEYLSALYYHDTLDVDHPYRVYFDSTHYVRVDSYQTSQGIPIYAKYDSDGNLLWLNQMYMQTEDTGYIGSYVIWNDFMTQLLHHPTKLTWDSSYVYSKLSIYVDWQPLWYLMGWSFENRPWHPYNWYLDSNYTMQVTLPDSHAAMESMRLAGHSFYYRPFFVMVYDRETGAPVRYFNPLDGIPPLDVWEASDARFGKILTTDDDLLIGCTRQDQLGGRAHRYLLRYNKQSGTTTVLDSNCAYAAHQLENLHPDGWLIGREPEARSGNQIPLLPDGTADACYVSCYYLPDFDRRRHVEECALVEEVRVTHVVEDDVSLTWRGGANHIAWQVAYLPTDAATDSTAWEHALLVETTDTTLTLPLDTCCLLRVRGICDAENRGPWSEPVEACPQRHMGIGTAARQPFGPTLTPNPATEAVNVVDAATGAIERQVIELEVISPLGQTVMRLRGISRFNVADLASGTYMVKIRTPCGTTLRKLTVR